MLTMSYSQFRWSDEYAHTYALVNFTTGEVRTIASHRADAALRTLYKRMDGEAREAAHRGEACHQVLANCVTNKVVAESKVVFGKIHHLRRNIGK